MDRVIIAIPWPEKIGKVKSIDCTWGLMSKSGESSVTRLSDLVTTHFEFFFLLTVDFFLAA